MNSNDDMFRLLKSFSIMPQLTSPIKSPSHFSMASTFRFTQIEPLSLTIAKFENEFHDKCFNKYLKPYLEEEAELLFKCGWWFILSLPDDFFYEELKNLEITPDSLTNEIVKYYNNDNCLELKNIVKEWKLEPFLNNKKIFKDALWAHNHSRFTLTVPALTIQVEGVIRSYLDHINKQSIHPYKKELKERYKKSITANQGIESFMQEQNLKFLERNLNNLYKSFKASKPKAFDDIYRNPIVHGQHQNYYSIEISTKLFLFLDMIHDILNDLEHFTELNSSE